MSSLVFYRVLLRVVFSIACITTTLGCQDSCGVVRDCSGKYPSCAEIKYHLPHSRNGLYDIYDAKGSAYRTYCDMETGGGGWTLVASVHENFLGGKCVTGDRWSSEHGNNPDHPHGDGNWENLNTFGRPESATSDDYKNPGYFNMKAKDVMIWHVPNGTPMNNYEEKAFMMYHTEDGFLRGYGGNLYHLFKDNFPLRDNMYARVVGNGPSPPVVWDRGNNEMRVQNTPPNLRAESVAGFIQFRAINHEKAAFAVCPGLKMTGGNVEHGCMGGTSFLREGPPRQCGDFGAIDWDGYGTGRGWSANLAMTESVVMIFYR